MTNHSQPPPLASARWIVGGLAATLFLAVACVYLTFCLLFWQGQWQLVFHPSNTVARTPASSNLRFDKVSFDATETGVLQLTGWWIPAEPRGNFSQNTLLVLHDGSGSLSDCLPQLEALHQLGINVFAFDYRGFGESVRIHPSEASTRRDAEAAWAYLTETRHIAPAAIAVDGVGLGAVPAAEIARRNPTAMGLILENPAPPVLDSLQLDTRTHWLPVRLLFHDRFDIAQVLPQVTVPKLVIYFSQRARYAVPGSAETAEVNGYADGRYTAVLDRFFGKYTAGR
jgi:uncharacterized protein